MAGAIEAVPLRRQLPVQIELHLRFVSLQPVPDGQEQ
jgi:hypothetical protein